MRSVCLWWTFGKTPNHNCCLENMLLETYGKNILVITLLLMIAWANSITSLHGENVTLYASPSSLVTFPGMDEKEVNITQVIHWEKVSEHKGNMASMEAFLQFHVGSKEPSLINKYSGRIDFRPTNGSLVFKNLTYADAGCYRLSINLRASVIRFVCLNIIDKLSKPSIWINSSSVHSTIHLSCTVDGDSPSYQWWKDGREVSQDQLLDSNKSLIIQSASRSDCGNYTCNVANPVSSVQANYLLAIHGLPLVETIIVVTSIIGIVSSAVAFFGLLLLCFLRREVKDGSLRQSKYLFLLPFICNTLSLLVISIALISWIAIKGAASASVVALVIVVILLPLNVCLTITIWNLGCECLRKFLDCTGLRASIDFGGIVSSIIVIAISIVILIEEIQQSNQGCHVSYLAWSTVAPLIIAAVIIFSSFLIVWKRGSSVRNGSNNEETPEEQIRMNQLDQRETANEDDSSARNGSNNEETPEEQIRMNQLDQGATADEEGSSAKNGSNNEETPEEQIRMNQLDQGETANEEDNCAKNGSNNEETPEEQIRMNQQDQGTTANGEGSSSKSESNNEETPEEWIRLNQQDQGATANRGDE